MYKGVYIVKCTFKINLKGLMLNIIIILVKPFITSLKNQIEN